MSLIDLSNWDPAFIKASAAALLTLPVDPAEVQVQLRASELNTYSSEGVMTWPYSKDVLSSYGDTPWVSAIWLDLANLPGLHFRSASYDLWYINTRWIVGCNVHPDHPGLPEISWCKEVSTPYEVYEGGVRALNELWSCG